MSDAAFQDLLAALRKDPQDGERVTAVEAEADASGRWGETLDAANEWLQAEKDPARTVALCLLIGKWFGTQLEHPEYARPYFVKVLLLQPNNAEARRMLARFQDAEQASPVESPTSEAAQSGSSRALGIAVAVVVVLLAMWFVAGR